MGVPIFSPSTQRQSQLGFCDFKASLVYKVSSSLERVYGEILSQKEVYFRLTATGENHWSVSNSKVTRCHLQFTLLLKA